MFTALVSAQKFPIKTVIKLNTETVWVIEDLEDQGSIAFSVPTPRYVTSQLLPASVHQTARDVVLFSLSLIWTYI